MGNEQNAWDWAIEEIKSLSRETVVFKDGENPALVMLDRAVKVVKQAQQKQVEWLKECENFEVNIANSPDDPYKMKIMKKAVFLSSILNHINPQKEGINNEQ